MIINEELKKIIPPLSQDELNQLENNLLKEGCRDALIAWNDTLIDGHNRYAICIKHNIEYKTQQIEFASINDVKLWMIDNQKGRRNLSDGWKYQLSSTKRDILAGIGKEKKIESGKESRAKQLGVLSIVDKTPTEEKPHNTRKEIAKDLGWSTGKVATADKVFKQSYPDVKQAILDDKISINTANKILEFEDNTQKEIIAEITANTEEKPTEIIKKYNLAQLNTGDEEWYTPEKFIESARVVMGSIDLDPASNAYAQKTVKANAFYTKDDDGLDKEWHGNVWLNPPYTARIINKFLEKIETEYLSGNLKKAIVLTNSNTDTSWFHRLANISSCLCFTKGRINFYKDTGEKSSPTNGQMFFYVGNNVDKFKDEFGKHGFIVVKA